MLERSSATSAAALRGSETADPLRVSAATALVYSGLDTADDVAHYQYMPHEKVILCGMPKCGTTSLYNFIYQQAFRHPWNYTGAPFIQDVMSERWEDKFTKLSVEETRKVMLDPATFSFATIRDPVKRVISAWKSKIACDGPWGTDTEDRAHFVPHLLSLADEPDKPCLSIGEFVRVLAKVHHAGKAQLLNAHFRPQQYGCFRDFAPSMWSKMASLGTNGSAAELGARFGNAAVTEFPHSHRSSGSASVNMSGEDYRLLHSLCESEYKLFEKVELE